MPNIKHYKLKKNIGDNNFWDFEDKKTSKTTFIKKKYRTWKPVQDNQKTRD